MKAVVKKGQIWQDWDIRLRVAGYQRFIEIIHIHWTCGGYYATCRNIKTRRETNIKLSRFKETSTGYKLVNTKPTEAVE